MAGEDDGHSQASRARVFTTLTPTEEEFVLARCRRLEAGRGEILIRKGEDSNSLYIVERGELHVIDEKAGRRDLLAVLGPGEIFGEMSFLDPAPRSATASSHTRRRSPRVSTTLPATSSPS